MSEKDFLFRRFISLACQPLYLLALSPSSLTEMPNPAGFYSFVVPRPPGTNCKARRSVSISTSIHLTKDAAEISNKVSCRLLYELRFFVMINYDFQKTAVYKNCGSFGLHQVIKVFVSCKEKEKNPQFQQTAVLWKSHETFDQSFMCIYIHVVYEIACIQVQSIVFMIMGSAASF